MKILIVCKSLPHRITGGIQTHTWKLSEWLLHLGHEVSILSAGSFLGGTKRYFLEGCQIIEIPYLPGRKLPLVSTFAEELAFNVAAARWLRVQASKFDVVHLQGRSGCMYAGAQLSTPVVTTFHGLVSVENTRIGVKRRFSLGRWLHEYWATFFERRAMQHSDANIGVSQEMGEKIRLLSPNGRGKVVVVPNGVDTPPLPESSETDPNLLLFVGRIERIKGIYPLVEAMQQVPAHIHLIMIGEGAERAGLERQIVAAGLQERIKMIGAQPSKVVFEYLHRATALVLPSFYETLSIVLLEANACGKPIVASDLPGMREVIQHQVNGLLVPPGEPETLAKGIAEIFADPSAAARMGEAGWMITRERYSWQKIALQTERLYGNLLAQKINPSVSGKAVLDKSKYSRFTKLVSAHF